MTVLLTCAAPLGCSRSAARGADAPGQALADRHAAGIGTAMAEDGQWTIPAKDYQSTRFSGLNQITPANVARLRTAWTFSTGIRRGHEAAPLIVGSTMYIVSPFPNQLFDLDLNRSGAIRWVYTPRCNARRRAWPAAKW